MSVSAISSGSNPYSGAFRTAVKQGRADLQALGTAIQSLDLDGARKAFAALQQNSQDARTAWTQGTQAALQSSPSARLKTDLQALDSALQSGDIEAAQTAFATLQQDFQAVLQRYYHPRPVVAVVPGPVADAGSDPTSNGVSETGPRSGGSTIDVKS